MTYSELLVQLLQLNAEQLRQDVTVYDSDTDEHYPADKFEYTIDYPIISF